MNRLNMAISFRYRGLIGIILLLPVAVLLAFSRPTVVDGSILDIVTNFLGWLLFVLYIVFRLWSTLYVGGRKDRELQTQGPYSVTRNPLYFGSLCFALSAAFFCKSIIFIVLIFVLSFIYSNLVVPSEENHLRNLFGKTYDEYYKRVPRLIPNFSLYQTGPHIQVELRPLEKEIRRCIYATCMPIAIKIFMFLRLFSWWPHWFNLK